MFWVWILILAAVIVGASVVIGKSLSGPRGGQRSRQEKITALKASGALKHRKSNQ
ncbi:MAG: hypothetical protein KJZ75_01485 [Hyphomonadaceae bacterium]|nr:hypothetical protein [Hyphomonadaceae bacterium]GIK50066.1 MAG: hypothetical protein BroJett013_27630 [Alphaproteobacteria bacterium]